MSVDTQQIWQKVTQWCRGQAGWLVIICYFSILIWCAQSLWHIRSVPLFLAIIIGLVFPLVITVGLTKK